MTARIDRLWPDPAENLSDDDLVGALGNSLGLRVNFVESIDGAATVGGRSGGMSDAADHRRFELLRRVADAVIVGAGTVRIEGYGPLRVSDASADWRVAHGMSEHPVFVIVSRALELDPGSRIFTEARVRPVIVTTASAAHAARARFDGVADLIAVGDDAVDLGAAIEALRARGLSRLLCEGGPSLFGALLSADLVDELCITVAPQLTAGDAPRIANSAHESVRGMRLLEVLKSGSGLLLRYLRD
ncbi:MAG: pyrimidine reductase family protein [Pseudolysinimonas sp.]